MRPTLLYRPTIFSPLSPSRDVRKRTVMRRIFGISRRTVDEKLRALYRRNIIILYYIILLKSFIAFPMTPKHVTLTDHTKAAFFAPVLNQMTSVRRYCAVLFSELISKKAANVSCPGSTSEISCISSNLVLRPT